MSTTGEKPDLDVIEVTFQIGYGPKFKILTESLTREWLNDTVKTFVKTPNVLREIVFVKGAANTFAILPSTTSEQLNYLFTTHEGGHFSLSISGPPEIAHNSYTCCVL
jgi:hypothetical protein